MTRMDDIRAVHQGHNNPHCDACYLLSYIDALNPRERQVCHACGRRTIGAGICTTCQRAGHEAQELFYE